MLSVIKIAILVYLGLALLMFFMQERLIFPSSHTVYATPEARGWVYDDLRLSVDGETTHAWYLPVEDARGTVLFSHGNAGCISDRLDSLETFRDLQFNVLIYDYGGYGESSGRSSERRCYADIRAAWEYLTKERAVAPGDICLFGRSLGGGPTAQLATEVQAGAVILESAFTSVVAMARGMVPFLPVKLFLRHRFDNAAKVGAIASPKLFVHGPEDEIVPYSHGRTLFDRASEPKAFLELRGGHNDGFYVTGMDYLNGLDAFLAPLFDGEDAAVSVLGEQKIEADTDAVGGE